MVSFREGIPGGNTSSTPSTLYIPIASPPTPAPSPGPFTHNRYHNSLEDSMTHSHFPLVKEYQSFAHDPTHDFSSLDGQARLEYLNKIIAQCTPKELSHISTLISPLLKRNFLQELPTELALHVLSYIGDFHELVRGAGGVCKYWRRLSNDDLLWTRMCQKWEFEMPLHLQPFGDTVVPGSAKRHFKVHYLQRKFINPISRSAPTCTHCHEFPRSLTHSSHQERNGFTAERRSVTTGCRSYSPTLGW